MKFTLAHISDVHLGPMPVKATFQNFQLKRMLGSTSWHMKRAHHHLPEVSAAIVSDIKAQNVDHIAFTGDLINIAALSEFPRAALWLENLGSPQDVSFVPGNHDTYVSIPYEQGLKAWESYMRGEAALQGPHRTQELDLGFPYVRFLRNHAIIGLTSAVPQSLFEAGGTLGEKQLRSLKDMLHNLKQKGYYRLILIHHPPLTNICEKRKALTDTAAFEQVIREEGAELILHGHTHQEMLHYAKGPEARKVPVVGVTSTSMAIAGKAGVASWNQYEIERKDGRWITDVTIRSWQNNTKTVIPVKQFTLSS